MREKIRSVVINIIKSVPSVANRHLDSLNIGDTVHQSMARYRHIETGEEYTHLAGGIAWPGEAKPGFILIVGVSFDREANIPIIVCLEESEDAHIAGILSKCLSLRERYGYRKSQNLFRFWYGDPNRFAPLVTQFNQSLHKQEEPEEGVYQTPPVDFQQPNRFELYLHRIQNLLTPDTEGRKSLLLGNCNILRNALQNLPPNAALHYCDDDTPPVAALGYVVHSLMTTQPWTHQEYISVPTINTVEEFERYAQAQQKYDPFFNDQELQRGDVYRSDVE